MGRVGWRQSTLTGYDIVDAENLASASGYYFQDGSKLVTIKNIHEVQENDDISNDDFNTYLRTLQSACITDVLNKTFSGKPSFLENVSLFPYEQDYSNVMTLGSKFRGFKIDVGNNNRVLNQITSISLSFDAEDTFNIYLYHSSKKTPIQTKSVTVTAGEDTKVVLNWELPKRTKTRNGGVYYLGYNESEVTASPYLRDYDAANFQVPSNLACIDLLTLDINAGVIDVNSDTAQSDPGGISFEMSSYTDYTDLIVENLTLFDRAVMMQMAASVLEQIVFSTRSNITERITKGTQSAAYTQLNGLENAKGLYTRIGWELSSLKKQLFPEMKQAITRVTLS